MYLAYCDDEEIQLEYMRRLAEQWGEENQVTVRFMAYRSAEEVLFENMLSYPFDLLLLDIDMKDMNGMELARKIRESDKKLPIVFLTNRREYVFEGYEVNALRYLLKPMDKEKLYPLLDEIENSGREEKSYLIEAVAGEKVKLYLEDIIYIETQGHYLTIHTESQNYELKKSLTELEEELRAAAPARCFFVSTHRSFLVNIAYAERVMRTECVLSEGSRVPVSRNSYKHVNEAFISYYK